MLLVHGLAELIQLFDEAAGDAMNMAAHLLQALPCKEDGASSGSPALLRTIAAR